MTNVHLDHALHQQLTQQYGQHIEDARATVKRVMASAEAATGWVGASKTAFHGSTQNVVQAGHQVLAALDDVQQALHSGGNELQSRDQDNAASLTNLNLV